MKKRCSQCGELRVLSDFYARPKPGPGADGLRSECKHCSRARKHRQYVVRKTAGVAR